MPKLMRFAIVAALLSLASFAWAEPLTPPQHKGAAVADANQPGRFKFAIITDLWGAQRPGDTILDEAVKEINRLDPDFVICVGDLIKGYVDPKDPAKFSDTVTRMWEKLDADVGRFKRPFYYVFGNHDSSNADQERVIRERYGTPYYSFDHKGCHFVVLFTEPFDAAGQWLGINKDDAQIAWLEKDLAASRTAAHTFVFFHQPWPAPRVMDLFKDRPTTVYAGHWHSYTQFVKDGVDYHVLSSTGGGIEPDFFGGEFYHYAVVSSDGKEASTALVRVGAVVADDFLNQTRLDALREARISARNVLVPVPRNSPVLVNQPFEVRLANPFAIPAKGTCEWTIPPGSLWTVTPAKADVLIEPGRDLVLKFSAGCLIDPFATPPTLLPRMKLSVLGNRALTTHSPLVAGLDPLYDLTASLAPDRWPYGSNLDALRRAFSPKPVPLAADFRHAYSLDVKNPWDKPLALVLTWENANPKWAVSPATEMLSPDGGDTGTVKFEAQFLGKPEEAFPLPRLVVKATLEGQAILDESFPLAVDATGFFTGVKRTAKLRELKARPALDGSLDDYGWQDATLLDGLIDCDGRGEPLQPTRVKVGATSDGLWVAFSCREPKRNLLRTKALAHDGAVWEDDSVEIFVDPAGDRKSYYQFIVNAAGVTYEGKEKDGAWNGPWEARIGWPKDGWSAEVFIPWTTLGGKPAAGTKMGFNVARNRVVTGRDDEESSAWSPTLGTSHNPEKFGQLIVE